MLYQETLPVLVAIRRFCDAASVASALLPEHLKTHLMALDWERLDSPNLPDPFDITEAVVSAAYICQMAHLPDIYMPSPRGVDVHIAPSGGVDLVWESDTHTLTLRFCPVITDRTMMVGGFDGSGLETEAVLICEYEDEASERLAICKGESV